MYEIWSVGHKPFEDVTIDKVTPFFLIQDLHIILPLDLIHIILGPSYDDIIRTGSLFKNWVCCSQPPSNEFQV